MKRMCVSALALSLGFGFLYSNTNSLHIKTVLTDGTPIPGVHFFFTGERIPGLSGYTSVNGNYRMMNLPSGEYKLNIREMGFSEQLFIIDICCGETIDLKIQLATSHRYDIPVYVSCPLINKRSCALKHCWTNPASALWGNE